MLFNDVPNDVAPGSQWAFVTVNAVDETQPEYAVIELDYNPIVKGMALAAYSFHGGTVGNTAAVTGLSAFRGNNTEREGCVRSVSAHGGSQSHA